MGDKSKSSQMLSQARKGSASTLIDASIGANKEEDTQVTCVNCSNTFVDVNDKLMNCERCSNWYCIKCLEMKKNVYEALTAVKNIHWFCDQCHVCNSK